LLSTPSRMKLFCSARCPFATKSPVPLPRVPPNGGATPAVNCAMYTQLRPFRGVLLIVSALITCPTSLVCDSSKGISVETVTS
jgi:hypothetical protein